MLENPPVASMQMLRVIGRVMSLRVGMQQRLKLQNDRGHNLQRNRSEVSTVEESEEERRDHHFGFQNMKHNDKNTETHRKHNISVSIYVAATLCHVHLFIFLLC